MARVRMLDNGRFIPHDRLIAELRHENSHLVPPSENLDRNDEFRIVINYFVTMR